MTPRFKFSGLVGEGVAILRAVRASGPASPFEPSGFSLELHADDLRALGEKALLLAAQADDYRARGERIAAAPPAVQTGIETGIREKRSRKRGAK